MKTLYHPHVPDWSIEVEDNEVDAFAEQGWRKTEPKNTTTTSTKSGEGK